MSIAEDSVSQNYHHALKSKIPPIVKFVDEYSNISIAQEGRVTFLVCDRENLTRIYLFEMRYNEGGGERGVLR